MEGRDIIALEYTKRIDHTPNRISLLLDDYPGSRISYHVFITARNVPKTFDTELVQDAI